MRYLDEPANPIRQDAAGRNVVVPLRWFGPVYLLRNDAELARVERGYKWLRIASVIFIGAAIRMGLLEVFPLIAGNALWVYVLTRGLVRSGMHVSDLPRTPRPEAIARSITTLGAPLLSLLLILGVTMSAGSVWAALRFRGAEFWFGATLFALVSGLLVENIITARNYRRSVQRSRMI
jgi:hypothetical protein